MTSAGITHGLLHAAILQFIIDRGYAPEVDELAAQLGRTPSEITQSLYALQEYHGVVLHPNSTRIWVIHPFSLAPTNFAIRSETRVWWGNCAWCSLGAAALLNRDVAITTTLGADGKQVTIHIRNGQIVETGYYVHFPIPMIKAWDNVTYTCSTMLLFEHPDDIERWCSDHHIAQGDVQPIEHIWQFSRAWYGNHLNPQWEKWTNQQAKEIFEQFNLTHTVWQLPASNTRF